MAWTTPRTWVAAEVVTAAIMNTHVRDNFNAIGDPWFAFTPSWTATTTNPTLGNGTIAGASVQTGSYCTVRIVLTMGTTTTFGAGNWVLSLPRTSSAGTGRMEIPGNCWDSSPSGDYPVMGILLASASTIPLRCLPGTAGTALANVTPTAPITWASGDQLTMLGTFEAA